jgi:hypothetical protein
MSGTGADFATAGPDTTSPIGVHPEQLRAWSGTYRSSTNDDLWTVTEKEGRLWLTFEDNLRPLRPLNETEYVPLRYVHETHLKFEPAHGATPRRLIVSSERPAATTLTLEAIEVPTLSTTEWATYAGDYSSDELLATYRLRMHGGKLWLEDLVGADGIVHRGTIPSDELHAIAADEFVVTGPPLLFRFTRDAYHSLTGFILNAFNERGIVFRRISTH